MKILFDKNVPYPLKKSLVGYDIEMSEKRGWGELSNGKLLSQAELNGFDVLITSDQNIRYQNNLTGKKIALLVLPSNRLSELQEMTPKILEALHQIHVGEVFEIPRTQKRFRLRH